MVDEREMNGGMDSLYSTILPIYVPYIVHVYVSIRRYITLGKYNLATLWSIASSASPIDEPVGWSVGAPFTARNNISVL